MNDTRRPCPVCDSLGARNVLYHQRFSGETAVGSGYDVVICINCGAGFADGIPTQLELDRYYSDASKYEYGHNGGAESPYDLRRFETIADQINSVVPNRDARILDVGCATGGLLACLGRRGYKNLLGSDPSRSCTVATGRLHGIRTVTATIAEHVDWECRFDLIILVGVLEHLHEVQKAIQVLRGLLAPNGVIYCAQPDAAAFRECVNAPYQQFSTEHVNFFTVASLNRLMRRCGFVGLQTWCWILEWREGITDSAVSGIFGVRSDSEMVADESESGSTEGSLLQYLEQCAELESSVRLRVENFVASQEPILVWGAGTLTRRLLATSDFGNMNIIAFIDSNPHVAGTTLAGRRILTPAELKLYTDKIVICSKAFEREIERVIRDDLAAKNSLEFFFLPQSSQPFSN